MRLGVKATLLLAAGYVLLMVAFAVGVDRWLRSFEDATTNETVRLLAREQAAILSELTYEALVVADGESRTRLRSRVEDVVLMSEVLSSMTVVDGQGKVVASDRWPVGLPFPIPAAVFAGGNEIRAEPLSGRPFFSGGDYAVYLPFDENGRVIGYLRMDFHSDRVADLYGHARRQLLVLALAGLSGVVLLGLLLQLQMARRAETLARALGDTGPQKPLRTRLPGDEFARALAAAERVRRELTEARAASSRLHQGFGALAQVMKVGVLLLREDRQLDFANARALELFGLPDVEALRAWWSASVSGLFASVGEGAPGEPRFASLERPGGGGPLRLEVYRQGGGDCDEYLALVHDPQVLDTLETDVRLASQLDGLARTYRTAAHEIRSPLSALMINLDLLRETLDVDDAREDGVRQRRETYVSVLRDELTRLNRSLAEMLTHTIPAPDSQQRFDLRDLVAELGTLLAPQGRRQGIEVSTGLPPDAVPLVGYRDRLKQAFLNIAVNALEAMPKGGRMRIEMDRCQDRVRVTVRDTGPGIPPELLARIYESDFTTKGGGSGIGLYVAR
ncbi:MAG TPA: ATP-binding protein, partial [Vicinamibacteria bacterium]|nr:ATP-binding protein [Vicinamibacteria bacterium]